MSVGYYIRRSLVAALCLCTSAFAALSGGGGGKTSTVTYQVTIQSNWNAITCQVAGTNRVTTDLGLEPESGDQISVFNLATQSFSNFTYNVSSWTPYEPTLTPGQGAFYFSQRSFVWTVTGSNNTSVLPLNLSPGVASLVGCQSNTTATFDQIAGYAAPSGTLLYRLIPGAASTNLGCGACFQSYSNVAGVWQPSIPVANMGEAVFINLLGAAPMITNQPQSQTAGCGGGVEFFVGATGALPLSYQWLSNNVIVPGAIHDSLHVGPITLATESVNYSVTVTNAFGSVTSTPATVTVLDTNPPSINCPNDIIAPAQGQAGALVNFSVTGGSDCSPVTITATPPSGSMFPIGQTMVNAVATDAAGNSNTCYFYVNVIDMPDVSISISAPAQQSVLGSNITFTVIVTNAGPGPASNIVATAFLPAGIDYISATSSSGTVNEASQVITAQVPELDPNSALSITVTGLVSAGNIDVLVSAIVTCDNEDTNLDNNSASLYLPLLQTPFNVQPFWFSSTIISHGQLILTLAGPTNQVCAVNTSTDLSNWSFGFNTTLDSNGISTITLPLSSLAGGHYYAAQYAVTLTGPSITMPPTNIAADAGNSVSFAVQASGSAPLSYQWFLNNNVLPGQNNATLDLSDISTNDAGTYAVVVSNSVGTTSASATLTVVQWNYGIAPDPPYPTLLASGGARHQVVPGFCLGSIETIGVDAMPEPYNFLALTPLPAGNDGVQLPAAFVPNQTASILVTASAPGLLDAWIDYNGDGNWGDTNDQICASLPLSQGTNTLTILVPPSAVQGQAWSRFRFSSAGGLSYDGDADDGEVEDYPVTINATPSLSLSATASPDPVVVGGVLNYVLTVANSGPVSANGVTVSNVIPGGASLLSYSASQGVWTTNNGVIIFYLGSLSPNASATIQIAVSPTSAGAQVNTATATATQPGGIFSTTVVTTATALTPPLIVSGPSNLVLSVGDSASLDVTATGSSPLVYQWYHNSATVAMGTDATLPLYSVTAADAGSYWVQVSNAVGTVISTTAIVTVQQDYLVTSAAAPGGTINPAGDSIVMGGASLAFVATPDVGYTVDSWYLDGTVVLTNQSQFTLTNISTNHTVSVTFDNSTNYDPTALTGPWYYNTNGIDLGTGWSQVGYDFSSWSNGPALFVPPAYSNLYPVPFGTALNVGSQTTFYFLRQFMWDGNPANTNFTLVATNYITSGAVFYLNGIQVGQVRMTNNPVTYDSLALPQMTPGVPDILNFPVNALVTGTNIIAVEVHQSDPGSADVAFAMAMNVTGPKLPTLTLTPTEMTLSLSVNGMSTIAQSNTIVAVGQPAGGTYQWNFAPTNAGLTGSITPGLTATTSSNSTSTIIAARAGSTSVIVTYTDTNGNKSAPATCQVNVVGVTNTVNATNGTPVVSGSCPVFNPSPIVVLDNLADPGAGLNPQVMLTGTVTSFIAPISADHIFINGAPAASATLTSSGNNGLGPFVQTFKSQSIYIGDDDFALVAAAVSSLNNVGYGSMHVFVNRSTADGSIASRTLKMNPSVPALPANLNAYLAPYQCQVTVTDAKAAATVNTVTASINTGSDMKTVTLTKAAGTGNFVSPNLYYVPSNLALPQGTTAAVTGSRIKAQFGQFVTVTYQPAGGGAASTTQLVPTGILMVQKGVPLNFIQSGVAADVTAATNDIPFTIQAGIDSRFGAVNSAVTVASLDKFQSNFALPSPANLFAPVQILSGVVKMKQASTDPATGSYNLYTSSCAPIMAICRRMPVDSNGVQIPNAGVTPLTVTYRGYVSAALSTGMSNTEPVAGVGFLLANPSAPTSTNLNPPMVESDFLPEFNPNPYVLINTPATAQGPPIPANLQIPGEIINFINPTVQANVTVNGKPVTTFTPDAKSPQYGPWHATFSYAYPIDMQLAQQDATVAVWDFLNDLGLGGVTLSMQGGGIDATGNPIATTTITPDVYSGSTGTPTVKTLVQLSNSLSLAGAMAVMRNNQFRIEANPILRGNLPWMFNNNSINAVRQTDGNGTVDATSQQTYPFDVSSQGAATLVRGGGGAATARLVLIPQLLTADNVVPPAPAGAPQVLSFRANSGVFVQASLNGQKSMRPALASPNGAYIMGSTAKAQVDTVVPGTYRDVGGNPADISVLFRVGASGFDPAAGGGRTNVTGTFNTIGYPLGAKIITQPDSYQLSAMDTGLPVAAAMDRQQFVNFPICTTDVSLNRVSNDPNSPLFHMYQWQKPAPMLGEQSMTVISTGLYPAAAKVTPDKVSSATKGVGLQYGAPGNWVQLQCAAAPNAAVKPIFGADLAGAVPGNGNNSTQTDANSVEIANNFSGHRDFCIQLQERPMTLIKIIPGPPTAMPVENFWLRVERPYVDPGTDLVPAGQTGRQVVGYLDTDPAADFQAPVAAPLVGTFRFPPAAANYKTLIGIGTAGATEAPNVGANVPAGLSQIKFEGVNLPNVAIAAINPDTGNARRALPPQRYSFRPVMVSPTGGGRYVLGRDISFTVPVVINAKTRSTYTDLNGTYGLIAGAAPVGGVGMTAAQQTDMVNAYFAQWTRVARRIYGTGTTAANRDYYKANAPNIRFVHPSAPQAQIIDFVEPCNVGGNDGEGSFGAAATPDVLNSATDETALTAADTGVFVSGYYNAFEPEDQNNSPFTLLRAKPYGSVAADNFAALQTALNGGILTMPGAINLAAANAAPPGAGAATRDQIAMNAATIIGRCFGRVLAHEVGHTLGLVSPRSKLDTYFTTFLPGVATQPKADGFHVGVEWSYNGGKAGQRTHEGQIYVSRKKKAAGPGFDPLPAPPAGTTQAAGDLPTYAQAVKALAAGVPVSDCDDLMLMPGNGQNFVMDSGGFQSLFERAEVADSKATFVPAATAAQQEPIGTFTARDILELQAVLPRN